MQNIGVASWSSANTMADEESDAPYGFIFRSMVMMVMVMVMVMMLVLVMSFGMAGAFLALLPRRLDLKRYVMYSEFP